MTSSLRIILAAAALLAGGTASAGSVVKLSDPAGDDNGPGNYTYPTDAVYKPGAFDITEFEVVNNADTVEFKVTVKTRIEDPWDSAAWGGNGFSVQMAVIHIDVDHKAGSGHQNGLPGFNVRFGADEGWDKAVIISPQGPTRVNSEIDQKAAALKKDLIVPKITRASGKTLIAVVDKKDLGGAPAAGWGYQVLMQSNEGFPDKGDLLTRKVNEFEGQHRFGGGTDYDNDPHVIDLLVPPGQKQADILSKWNKDANEPKPEDLCVVPLVYPGAK